MIEAEPSGQAKGRLAEDQALAYLKSQGLGLIARNYRCRYGEIDLVMEDRSIVVFVEVRFRGSQRFGGALESVDQRKQAKLIATATQFLKDKRLYRAVRFDVAALSPSDDGFAVEWVKDAFRAG